MLPERLSQLLTAYIDGELGARQRKAVQRLLRRSEEARVLLQKLRDDACLLRDLPRQHLEEDLSPRVLRSINERRLQVARRAALAEHVAFPNWAGALAAASVLIAAFWGSYLYFYAHQQRHGSGLAQKDPEKGGSPNLVLEPGPQHANNVIDEPKPVDAPSIPETVVVKTPEKPSLPKLDVPRMRADIPPAENPEGSVEARPSRKFETLEEIYQLPISLSVTLRDLEHKKAKEQLRVELQKEEAYRLELFTLGNSIAFERVKSAFEAHGIGMLIDQLAQFRLKNPGFKTDYVFYVEGITKEELAAILEKLGADDHKAEAILLSLTESDHKELSRLMGVDPTKLDPPRKHAIDIRKPITQLTAEQLRQAPPRPEPGKAVKPFLRQGLVLSYNPVRPKPSMSKEIKSFLDHRTERKQGTLQLLLVLREGSGS